MGGGANKLGGLGGGFVSQITGPWGRNQRPSPLKHLPAQPAPGAPAAPARICTHLPAVRYKYSDSDGTCAPARATEPPTSQSGGRHLQARPIDPTHLALNARKPARRRSENFLPCHCHRWTLVSTSPARWFAPLFCWAPKHEVPASPDL